MTQAPGPQPPASGILSDLLGRILQYIDRPWKAVVIIVLLIVGGAGWVLYQHETRLVEAWLKPSSPTLKIADIPGAIDKLVTETGADIVQIWEIDMAANSQRFIAALRSDGERPVIPSPRRLPVVVTTSDAKRLVSILAGSSVCGDLTEPLSPIVRRLAIGGMSRACAIPIPPSPEAFVGVIYLVWAKAAEPSQEDVAVGAAREIAGQLATR